MSFWDKMQNRDFRKDCDLCNNIAEFGVLFGLGAFRNVCSRCLKTEFIDKKVKIIDHWRLE